MGASDGRFIRNRSPSNAGWAILALFGALMRTRGSLIAAGVPIDVSPHQVPVSQAEAARGGSQWEERADVKKERGWECQPSGLS